MSDAGKGHGAAWCCGICVCVNMCALGNYSCNLLEAEIWTQAARKSNVCSYIYILYIPSRNDLEFFWARSQPANPKLLPTERLKPEVLCLGSVPLEVKVNSV